MGQTLTHGIYLPDEGERNCYSGLAANWQILDGSVGTIAAHTAALAGKAPLVHTHTKSDITDFPAYGNTAGTICEGNDSRLSDARTPVAHTHTKSDITDLFNSANTWSALNGYTKGIWLDGQREAYIFPENSASFSGLLFATQSYNQSFKFGDYTTSNDGVSFNFNNAYLSIYAGYYSNDNKNKVEISPRNADESSLGTATYKWKSLNGINPGALSLPKEEYSDVDISAQGLNWDLTGSSNNSYTPNRDGWLEIWVKRTSMPTAYISVSNTYVRQVSEATVYNFACVTCPVRNGQTYTVTILANECHVRIIKAEGNV